ncbi:glycosyltransferase family 2 protein [Pseudomonas sp. RIT623]|uniref:glycosyltransferase family 2 protein n=1 Tax=Pseudomonas sp. RIT623 TaxID=2559075 RepID=UPI00106FC605|nr:glycosyltransferase family 2 protein [Pseudomonas sp. RIT623]TFF33868.1 glycosyl transferase family 2 [Pseudomonas sp. RIT623]
MLNIVIPMAGAGSRFSKAGYVDPKPLIKIHGVPMIRVVIENLRPKCEHRFIFIVQREHASKYALQEKLKRWASGSIVIEIDGVTEGAACTVLAAKEYICNSSPLMIANSDQYVDCDIDDYLSRIDSEGLDGLIMTMSADDPKWSYVGFNANGSVSRVVEKEVISDEATVGIYNFRHGEEFVRAAEAMILNNERVNGEFYVAPAYDKIISGDKKVGVYNIGSEADGMYGLGIPADLDIFLALPLSVKAAQVQL